MKLHEVEAAFRSLKTDLGTRPVYHRRDSRIESHLFISVLAYAIMKSIVFSLNQKEYDKSWSSIMARVGNHQRATTIQKSKSGDAYYIRVTGTPEAEAREIYDLLNIAVRKNRMIKRQHSHL
jgi:transposase